VTLPRGAAIWITGLPASGKTTLAAALVAALRGDAQPPAAVLHLDSDDLRPHVMGDGGYDDAGRARLYGLLAHLAELGAAAGVVVVISATAHQRAFRDAARARVQRFVEVYMDVDRQTCAARDPKGLWRAAAEQRITTLPGAGVTYEPPLAPEVSIEAALPLADAVARVRAALAEVMACSLSLGPPGA